MAEPKRKPKVFLHTRELSEDHILTGRIRSIYDSLRRIHEEMARPAPNGAYIDIGNDLTYAHFSTPRHKSSSFTVRWNGEEVLTGRPNLDDAVEEIRISFYNTALDWEVALHKSALA